MRRLAALAVLLAAAVAPASAQEPPPGVLPDLVADPAAHTALETYDDAGVKRLLLRFDGYIHNAQVAPAGATGVPTAGAVDIRGNRASKDDPMQASQLVYAPDGTVARTITGTGARLEFATADGHDHWHLMHAASYSLWTADRTAEVAPAQKVGFCLDDAEPIEGGVGPYFDDEHGREFCRRGHPNATSLFEGIQPGWRDVYDRQLTYQWVDASDVAPGVYRLRTDVDPDGVIVESDEDNAPGWTTAASTIPGWVARPLAPRAGARRIRLATTRYGHPGARRFRLVTPPAHGRLNVVAGRAFSGASIVYTPAPGYRGPDRFTYVAADRDSAFPRDPPAATVVLGRGVAIGGLPVALRAGASAQLSAIVSGGKAGVRWSASAGRITANGVYTPPARPPKSGSARIEARTAGGARDVRFVRIRPADRKASPAPSPPPAAGSLDASTRELRSFAVGEVAGHVVLRAVPRRTGVVRLAALLGGREVGACRGRASAGQPFACRLGARRSVAAAARAPSGIEGGRLAGAERSRLAAAATLRIGSRVVARLVARGRYASGLSGLRLVCELPARR